MYSDNVHNEPYAGTATRVKKQMLKWILCRDRYEGQLNEFLLENKKLKEQLTTLKVSCSDVEVFFTDN